MDTTGEWKPDVDKGCYSLHRSRMLGSFEEVSLTRLITRVPFENVELGIVACGMCRLW